MNKKKIDSYLSNLFQDERDYLKSIFQTEIEIEIKKTITKQIKNNYRDRITEQLKRSYKDAQDKQKKALNDDKAYNYFEAKKFNILEICELYDLDALYIMGRKEHKPAKYLYE